MDPDETTRMRRLIWIHADRKRTWSGVERRHSRRPRTADDHKRTAIYVDYKEDISKRSGIYVDTERQEPNMDDRDDERTPLLQEKERVESKIIAEINRVDAQVDDLIPHAENLSAATSQYFGDDGKVGKRKQSCWKRLCCFGGE